MENIGGSYKTYWITWAVLLALTASMLAAEKAPLAKNVLIGLLLAAMITKALLIGAEYMHLRSEKRGLVLAVAGTVLFLSTFLIVLISFDATRILKMVTS